MLIDNPAGNYRFLTGIAPYSCGVVAMPGFEIIHVTFHKPVPYKKAFDQIWAHLKSVKRPPHALCAIQLRIPAPLSSDGFAAFNAEYQDVLVQNDLLFEGKNPIARTNISPACLALTEPSLYAFSYTVPIRDLTLTPTFIVAGAGDLNDQTHLSESAIVRPNETTPEALQEKAACVMQVMQERVTGLKVSWNDATTVEVYSVYPIHTFLKDTLLDQFDEAAIHGVHWHFGHPPIEGLAFEMDLRGVRQALWK